jgi:hypothetical protein
VIRWMCTHIYVSRRPPCAVHNLTGDTPSRASPEARHPAPHTVWLFAGVPYLTAVCCGAKPDGDCGLPVLLALQCVPYRARVSHRESRHTGRPRRAALHSQADDRLHALACALLRRHTQKSPSGLWLVPHAMELCHARSDAPGQTRHRGVGGNRAPLAPRERLGVETGEAGGQR